MRSLKHAREIHTFLFLLLPLIVASITLILAVNPAAAETISASTGDVPYLKIFGIPLSPSFGMAIMKVFLFLLVIAVPLTYLLCSVLILIAALKRFSVVPLEKAFAFGWRTAREHLPLYIPILCIALLLLLLPHLFSWMYRTLVPYSIIHALNSLTFTAFGYSLSLESAVLFTFIFLVQAYISLGLARIALLLIDNKQPRIASFFSSPRLFLPFAAGSVIYHLALYIGFVLLLVPGILIGSIFFFWHYRYVETGSLAHAIRDSLILTKGCKGEVFLFWFLAQCMLYAGFFVLGIGAFMTIPFASLASCYAYRDLSLRIAPPKI